MPRTTGAGRSKTLLVLVLLALAGCQYDYAPVQVEVRNRATLDPVEGATVRVSNARTLNPTPPTPAEGTTDPEGTIRLRAALYNTLLVRISAPGHADHLFNAEHPAVVGDVGWITPRFNQQGGRGTLEARLAPTSPARSDGAPAGKEREPEPDAPPPTDP